MRSDRTRRPAALALALAATLAVAAACAGWLAGLWHVPDRHDPWAPLAIAEAPGWTTRWKLDRAAADPAACRVALADAGWRVEPVPDRHAAAGCAIEDAVRVEAMRVRVREPFVLSCRAALSLALWESHVLWPAATLHLERAPVAIEHFGTVACRDVRGAPGVRSRHASADAIDVAGVVLDGGRRVTVARDWRGPDDASAFLRAMHRGACRFFDVVLGPGHDAAHADHLHLDRGPARACR